ncbi:hypothetical protein A4X09_0g857 [Tilletia walkeri]|uniref:Uncharacterized protein n=1 Tax=Tilletia walkeri TaxID=117179 RepID=A0A8X7NGF9_9BASI|nr:hypothetical protein A4X09_0g857 [Tilletia walkeri]
MASKLAASTASSACARSLVRSSAPFLAAPGRRLGHAVASPASSSPSLSCDNVCFSNGRRAVARYSTTATSSAESSKDDAHDAEEAPADESPEGSASNVKETSNRPRRSRALLLDPEDADSEPTLQALDRLRPQPYVRSNRRKSGQSKSEGRAYNEAELEFAERMKHWYKAARRVGQAFTKAQLVKIAREEIPVFSKKSIREAAASARREGSSPRGAVPRLEDNLRKEEIINRIMVHHWKLREPRMSSSPHSDVAHPSDRERADVKSKPEPTEWLFYPLDMSLLYVVLTALKDPLSEYTMRFQARFFPAQQEVEVPVTSQENEGSDPSSSELPPADETSSPTPATRIQQGLQITAFTKSDLEAIRKWLDRELADFQQSQVDLAPIYAAASHSLTTDPQQLQPPAAFLKEIALMSKSFLQPEGAQADSPDGAPRQPNEIVALPYRVTAMQGGRFRSRDRFPSSPTTILRQYAVERREQAGRPLFVYAPSSPSSATAVAETLGVKGDTNLGSGSPEAQTSSSSAPESRTRYALNTHHIPTPRPMLMTVAARARPEDLKEVLFSSLGNPERRHITSKVGTSSAFPKWRLERSMVSDALEGRGGLGFSLGYGVDLDSERNAAAEQQDGNEGDEGEDLAIVGQPSLILPPPAQHGPSTVGAKGSRTAELLGHANDSEPRAEDDSDAPAHHTYAATFGHLRFPSALPFDSELSVAAIQRARIHGLFCPPLPGSWPLSKLKRTLIETETSSDISPLEAFARLHRPTFHPALPPIALLPPDSISNTLSAVKSGSAAGDAWTRLMARAFGDLSSSIISPGSRTSSRARQPGAVLLEALKWMRSFKERSDSAKPFGKDQDPVVRTPKPKPTVAAQPSRIAEPTREDVARFIYVPFSAADRSRAPGRRLVIEAEPRYDGESEILSSFKIIRALWETCSSQADVLVPDAPIDVRMSHAGTVPMEPAAVLQSQQLLQFLSTKSTDPESMRRNDVRPMLECYNCALTAPTSISLPLRPDDAEETVDIQMQLESTAVLSRTTWPLPALPKEEVDAADEVGDVETEAWLVEETTYLDGSLGDASPSMRVEWRTSSSKTPKWARLAQDLDLLLDVPYGVCKGRSSYTTT